MKCSFFSFSSSLLDSIWRRGGCETGAEYGWGWGARGTIPACDQRVMALTEGKKESPEKPSIEGVRRGVGGGGVVRDRRHKVGQSSRY